MVKTTKKPAKKTASKKETKAPAKAAVSKKPAIKNNPEFEKKMQKSLDDAEDSLEEIEEAVNGKSDLEEKHVAIKASKPVTQIKKGDKVKVDSLNLEVDSQYVMIDHGSTKEMAIELFDPKTDKDYQLRYFSDQVETSLEFYELQEILYLRRPVIAVEW